MVLQDCKALFVEKVELLDGAGPIGTIVGHDGKKVSLGLGDEMHDFYEKRVYSMDPGKKENKREGRSSRK